MTDGYQDFLEDVLVYLDSQEAGLVQFRQRIKAILGDVQPSAKVPFDVSKIKWQDGVSKKDGKPFQFSEDYDNIEHQNLLKFLDEHAGGCVSSKDKEGQLWTLWIYPDDSKIGRKLKNPKKDDGQVKGAASVLNGESGRRGP